MKKILLSSDCNGNFELLFNKVNQLNQKNKFDLMFLVGNVCPIESSKQFSMIVKGEIKIPIPTYFITNGPISKIFSISYPNGKQLAQNFTFLGANGIRKILDLNVCFINGAFQKDPQLQSKGIVQNSQKQIKKLIKQYANEKIDILLTNQWPLQIENANDQNTDNYKLAYSKSSLVSQLIYYLSPKYHLSASGKMFYRMQPFLNKKGSYTHFINVAQIVKDNLKDKYLLAIQTIPYHINPPQQSIANSIISPFKKQNFQNIKKNNINQQHSQQNQETNFLNEQKKIGFRDSLKIRQNRKDDSRSQNSIDQNSYIFFDNVPFQARNDDIQQFLERWGQIIKIQVFKQYKGNCKSGIAKFSTIDETKNCLIDTGKYSLHQNRIKFKIKNIQQKYRHQDCWFCQKNQKFDKSLLVYRGKYCLVCLDKGPVAEYHLQIIPLNHVDTLGKLERVEVQQIELIKTQLKKFFSKIGYQTIICQRYIKLSQQISHCIIQLISLRSQHELIPTFYEIIQKQHLNFTKLSLQKQYIRKSQYFIKIELNSQTFIKQIYPKQKLQVQFMRRLICELINQPGKINWRSCERENNLALQKDKEKAKEALKEASIVVE